MFILIQPAIPIDWTEAVDGCDLVGVDYFSFAINCNRRLIGFLRIFLMAQIIFYPPICLQACSSAILAVGRSPKKHL